MRLGSAIVLCLIVLPAAARAVPSISGTFTGVAINTTVGAQSPMPTTVDGSPVTGRFSGTIVSCSFGSPSEGFCGQGSGGVSIVFSVAGQTITFADPISTFLLGATTDTQRLTLGADDANPYFNASVTLVGPPDAFASGTDLTTLHPGPITSGSISFLDGRGFFGGVRLTSVTEDDVTYDLAVPEPATLTVLAVACGALASRRSRRDPSSRRL